MSNKETKSEAENGSQTIPDELIDQLLKGYRKPEELTGPKLMD